MNQKFEEFRSNTFFYFRQECFLAKQLVVSGMEDLFISNSNFYCDLGSSKGYSAFFNLSIGIERLEKLALIFYHSKNASNDTQPIKLPTTSTIRNAGHDLETLFNQIKSNISADDFTSNDLSKFFDLFNIDNPDKFNINDLFSMDNISNDILKFLSDFARGARYENLDRLSGSGSRYCEPLQTWEKILEKIRSQHMEQDAYDALMNCIKEKEEIEKNSGVVSLLRDYSGIQLSVVKTNIFHKLYDNLKYYIGWYLYAILKPIIFSLNKWAWQCYQIDQQFGLCERMKNHKENSIKSIIPETWEIFSPEEYFISKEDFFK